MPRKKSDLPRLKKRRDFLFVARKGRKWATPGLVLQAWSPARGDQLEDNTKSSLEQSVRIGYTVSRKVGNAVARNRAKRRLRAVAGQVLPAHARAGTEFQDWEKIGQIIPQHIAGHRDRIFSSSDPLQRKPHGLYRWHDRNAQ